MNGRLLSFGQVTLTNNSSLTLLRALSVQAWAKTRELRRDLAPLPGFLGPSSPGRGPVASVGDTSCAMVGWGKEGIDTTARLPGPFFTRPWPRRLERSNFLRHIIVVKV